MTEQRMATFPSYGFSKRAASMVRVDARRMFTTPLFYVFAGFAFLMPVLILVMTTMVSGTEITDPSTGVVTTMDAFTNAWQIIASERSADIMAMDMTTMCNINLMYYLAGVFLCLFVAEDFRSGYAKNLFTVRAAKNDYILSKTLMGFLAGAVYLVVFFAGTILGGRMAGLSFDPGNAGASGIVLCMMAKVFLMAVFVSIFLLASVYGRHRVWISILLSLFAGMMLFMMIPMMTPLDSGVGNVGMCLAGGVIFAAAIGAISNLLLKRLPLV